MTSFDQIYVATAIGAFTLFGVTLLACSIQDFWRRRRH
jgi:hypothetical protein